MSADDRENMEREQQERREYVKNIGIEYRFGCYEEKRADSCQLLGEYMEALEQNFKGAFALFKQNCEQRQYPKSCYKYAMYLLAGKECEPDLKKMIVPLEVACDANIPQGCRYLSLVHWNGEKDRPANPALAETYMRKACELEDGEACWLLSTWLMGNQQKFVNAKKTDSGNSSTVLGSLPRDMDKSLYYATRACELGSPQSCANVSRMYKIGDGIAKDEVKAKEFAEKARDLMKALQDKDTNAGFTG